MAAIVHRLIVSCALLGAVLSNTVFAQAQVAHLDLPAQPLADAVRQLAKETNTNLSFDEHIRGLMETRQARALKAEVTVDQAFAELLAGSGLRHQFLDEHTVVLLASSAQAPVSGEPTASLSSSEGARLAQADAPAGDVASKEQRRQGQGESAGMDSDTTLEEITVTARKRSERLRDVPLSITALTAESIEQRGLFDAADYLRGVPGTNQVEGGPFGQSIVIRGIETSPISQNFNSGTTTATYFGETPTSNSAGMAGNSNVDIKLVDIDRVEVLRGPQGTAFGSSSLGGAVRTIPVAPRLGRFESKVAAGYSATSQGGGNNYNVHAVVNMPLAREKLALRALGYKYQDSGFYHNRAGSDSAFQTAVVTRFGVPASFAVDEDEVGTYDVVGGRLAALFQATDALRLTLSYLTQKSETDGVPMANSGLYEQTLLRVAPEQVHRGQAAGLYDTDLDLTNATMEYDLGWAGVLATYSHIESESINAFPFGYLGQSNALTGDARSKHRENVGEVRLVTQLEGPWDFLAGVYYEELDDGVGDPLFQTFYWVGDPATNPYNPGGSSLVGLIADQRHHRQKAAFGEVSWEFLPGLTLTGGARTYDYDRTRLYHSAGRFIGNVDASLDAGASGTNYRGNLSYKPNDQALLYAGFSQGFRLGRPQVALASTCDVNADGVIDGTGTSIAASGVLNSDQVDSYELGAKSTFFDRRLSLDAAIFRTEWTGIPVTLTAPAAPTGCGLNYTINAGAALSEGVEFQLSFQAAERLRLDLGGSHIHARLAEDVPAARLQEGNRLAGVPKVNANLGVQYDFAIGGYEAFLRADSIYIGSFFGNILESPNTEAGDYVKLDTALQVSMRNLSINLYVRNATDRDAFAFRRASASTSPFYGHRLQPRTLGLQLSYTFDDQ